MGPEFVRDGAQLAMAEMMLGGTTRFNDMYFFPTRLARPQLIPACAPHWG